MPTYAASAQSKSRHVRVAVAQMVADAYAKLPKRTPSFGLLFASPSHELQQALDALQAALPQTRLIGCSTAGEFTEEGLVHGGMAMLLIESDDMAVLTGGASGIRASPEGAVAALCNQLESHEEVAQTRDWTSALSVLLVDGLAGTAEQLVEDLRSRLGALHEIVGGAAGDEGRFVSTLVGSGKSVFTDGAVALHILSKRRFGLGVAHGLSAVTRAMVVTRAKGNIVYELDGKPAFEAYRDFARSLSFPLSRENASSFLIAHELGVFVFGKMRKARAPLVVGDDGSLRCAAEVPQGASVAILSGDKGALTNAATDAAREARARVHPRQVAGVLVFDCICREAILGRDFQDEIAAVRAVFPDTPIAGFLTYGEIARYSGNLDGWHNTTIVVVAIPA